MRRDSACTREVNLQTYEQVLRRAESLVYELAQFYSRDALAREPQAIFREMSLARQQAVRRNFVESASVIRITHTALVGKGGVLRAQVGLP